MSKLIGTSPNQVPSNADLGTAAFKDAKDFLSARGSSLSAIDSVIPKTAVDVFVYDTSLDSDGGAWRNRINNTSWYNEELNTQTRGNRKEFPVVAIIVVTSRTVTIYDADDPTLPMWMVIEDTPGGGATYWNYPDIPTYMIPSIAGYGTITAVKAVNGEIIFSIRHLTDSQTRPNGIIRVQFISDRAKITYGAGSYYRPGNIADRHKSIQSHGATVFGTGIISTVQIDTIDVIVRQNSTIDPSSGLPVPTIAVGTKGGVSLIRDDGSVKNDANIDGITPFVGRVAFQNDKTLYVQYGFGSIDDWTRIRSFSIPALEEKFQYRPDVDWQGFYGSASNFTQKLTKNAIGDEYGLILTDVPEDPGYLTASNKLIAHIGHDFNTGWMPGNIKLATLCSTDVGDIVGSELVTNGTFTTDYSSWTEYNLGTGTPTYTIVSNALQISLGGKYDVGVYQAIPTIVGKKYIVTYDLTFNTTFNAGNRLDWGVGNSAGTYFASISTTANGKPSLQFVAQSTTTYLLIRSGGGANTSGTYTIDNVSLRFAEDDRSEKNKGLQVFGTLKKTPVAAGADLVAYSGFSSNNYLRQPYNTDLDFGTGSYSVMGWFRTRTTSSAGIIIQQGPSDVDENLIVYVTATYGIYFDYGTGSQYSYFPNSGDKTMVLDTNWHHFVCHVSAGGAPKIFVDGKQMTITVTGNAPSTFTFDTDYALNIGNGRGTGNNLPFDGEITLIRISGSIPSDEQIKKMYEEERDLFQENAKATLYGTSNEINAIAYDPYTKLHHAGTTSGRSVFQKLRRIDYTTDPVGTAISVVNGMVAEE